jgi:hypothetical protein
MKRWSVIIVVVSISIVGLTVLILARPKNAATLPRDLGEEARQLGVGHG